MSGPVVINGMTDADSQPGGQRLAYPGSDTSRKMLDGWGYRDYLMIAPSKHTAAECDALIALARENTWTRVSVMSQPHHILRCMEQMVFCLDRAGSDLKVYAMTLPGMNWQKVAEKGVLNGVPFSGTLIDAHAREEFERTIKYADRDGTGYTPHATLEELIAYYERRDAN